MGIIPTLDFRSATEPIKFWSTGDWHLSAKAHDSMLFLKHFQRAVAEGWNLLHIGDALEMVTPTSKVALRGALKEQIADPEEQRKILIGCFKQLTGQGFILPGNHEFRIDMATGLDFMALVTDAVGKNIRPLDGPQRVRLLIGKEVYCGYLHHGEGPAANPITLFDRIQRDEEGLDFILAGHIHVATFDPSQVGSPNGDRSILRLRTGHYLVKPSYQLIRPTSRRGAPGSWLLEFSPTIHGIESHWLGN